MTQDASAIALQGHEGLSGVQRHSCGEIYPLAIKVVIHNGKGGYCQAWHASGTWTGPRREFDSTADADPSFGVAHEAAENDAREYLAGVERDRLTKVAHDWVDLGDLHAA